MNSLISNPSAKAHLPFISLVCWRNTNQANVEHLLRRSAKDRNLPSVKMLPGSPVVARCAAIPASPNWVSRFPHLADSKPHAGNASDASDNNQKPLSCLVWPLFGQTDPRSHQMFLLSDIVVVFVDSTFAGDEGAPKDGRPHIDDFLVNRIMPMLVVATSRAGIEANVSPLHCVFIDEARTENRDENISSDHAKLVNFCEKANMQQKRLNVTFSALRWDNDIVLGSRAAPAATANRGDSEEQPYPWELILDTVAKTTARLIQTKRAASYPAVGGAAAAAAAAEASDPPQSRKYFDPANEEGLGTTAASETSSSSSKVHQDTALKRDLHTFSIVGAVPNTTAVGAPEIHLLVAAHEYETVRMLLLHGRHEGDKKQPSGVIESRSDDETVVVTAARCPNVSTCELVTATCVFNNRRAKLVHLVLRARNPRLSGMFTDFVSNLQGAQPLTGAAAVHMGVFSTGSVWGVCRVRKPRPLPSPELRHMLQAQISTVVPSPAAAAAAAATGTGTGANTAAAAGTSTIADLSAPTQMQHRTVSGAVLMGDRTDSFNDDSSTSDDPNLADAVGFKFYNDFPACPQILIIRVPKLQGQHCRGIGGNIALWGFGGEACVDVAAIGSVQQRCLVEVAASAVGGACYYAFHVPHPAPLYIFERPWSRVVMTAGGGLHASHTAPHMCQPVEVMFLWRRFEGIQRMMIAAHTHRLHDHILVGSRASSSSSSVPPVSQGRVTSNMCDLMQRTMSFLGDDAKFALPINVSDDDDATAADDRVVASLFQFSNGLPGSTDLVQQLGRACVKALMTDLFGDVSGLLADPHNVARPSGTDTVANWLFVRGQQHHNSTATRGALTLAQWLFWLDSIARTRQATLAAAEICSTKNLLAPKDHFSRIVKELLNDDEEAFGFARRMVIRLGLLPFNNTAQRSGQKGNPLRTASTLSGIDPFSDVITAGWFTHDPRMTIESWELCVLMSTVTPSQLLYVKDCVLRSVAARFAQKANMLEQIMPTLLLANGNDAKAVDAIEDSMAAFQIEVGPSVSIVGKANPLFNQDSFLGQLLQFTSLPLFLRLMSHVQRMNSNVAQQAALAAGAAAGGSATAAAAAASATGNGTTATLTVRRRKRAAAAAALAPAGAPASSNDSSVSRLLDIKVSALGMTGAYALMSKPTVGIHRITTDGGRLVPFNISCTPLSRLGDVVVLQILMTAQHKISALPLQLLFQIVMWARGLK